MKRKGRPPVRATITDGPILEKELLPFGAGGTLVFAHEGITYFPDLREKFPEGVVPTPRCTAQVQLTRTGLTVGLYRTLSIR